MTPNGRAASAARVLLVAAFALCAGGSGSAPAADAGPPEPARGMDLARYFGRWYIIGRMPAPNGSRELGAYFEFRPRADGQIDEIYYAHDDLSDRQPDALERIARADPDRPADWEVSSGWFTTDHRLVLYVSTDYRHAIAGDPSREAGWILARESMIPEWSYAGLLARLALQGYDVSRFRRVPQRPEQIGQPGFE